MPSRRHAVSPSTPRVVLRPALGQLDVLVRVGVRVARPQDRALSARSGRPDGAAVLRCCIHEERRAAVQDLPSVDAGRRISLSYGTSMISSRKGLRHSQRERNQPFCARLNQVSRTSWRSGQA